MKKKLEKRILALQDRQVAILQGERQQLHPQELSSIEKQLEILQVVLAAIL